jgi:hypothetical protein
VGPVFVWLIAETFGNVSMKYLIAILLALLAINACVLWLLLVGTLIKRLARAFPIKRKNCASKDAWEPSLPTSEHRRSAAGD